MKGGRERAQYLEINLVKDLPDIYGEKCKPSGKTQKKTSANGERSMSSCPMRHTCLET